jgi:hypothetical protein
MSSTRIVESVWRQWEHLNARTHHWHGTFANGIR